MSGSVTTWLYDLREGDERVIYLIWRRYWQRLVRTAESDLHRHPGDCMEDAEDVAAKVFAYVCKKVQSAPDPPKNRGEFWRLMNVITYRRILDRRRLKKYDSPTDELDTLEESEFVGDAPDWIVVVNDDLDLLAELLGEDSREIVVLLMQGFDQVEIAKRMKSSPRTLQRRLAKIRDTWARKIANS
jgi:RNA polymerase sigma factor (sigma-70 family)